MKFSIKREKDIFLIIIEGDMIGIGDHLGVIDAANDAINEGIVKAIIDISQVRYINSSGIGTLVSLYTKFKNRSGEAVLLNPGEQTRKILSITKLDAIIGIYQTPEEARKRLTD